MIDLVAIVWTFNSDVKMLREVLDRVCSESDALVVVDNGSRNFRDITECVETICRARHEVIRLAVNLGVEALYIGMSYAVKRFNPSLILLLDDDTLLKRGAIELVKELFRSLIKLEPKIGAICLGEGSKPSPLELKSHGMFSGCFINSKAIASGVGVRKDFFLDQADFEFYDSMRSRGFKIIDLGWGIERHRLGRIVELKGRYLRYEPPARFYYIVRNSTVRLLERREAPLFYIRQIRSFLIPLVLIDGLKIALRTLFLGLTDGIFKRLGYRDPEELSSLRRGLRA